MKKLLLMALAMFAICACQSAKDTYIKKFNDFVKEVEVKAAEYTEADWENADQQFSVLSTEEYAKYENNLNEDEKAEILKLKATYTGFKTQSVVKDTTETEPVEELLNETK